MCLTFHSGNPIYDKKLKFFVPEKSGQAIAEGKLKYHDGTLPQQNITMQTTFGSDKA